MRIHLNPVLSGPDRIANFAVGVGLVAYALLGDFNQAWLPAVLVVAGIVAVVGAIGGT